MQFWLLVQIFWLALLTCKMLADDDNDFELTYSSSKLASLVSILKGSVAACLGGEVVSTKCLGG